jgi:hypothetical protein
VVIEGTPAGSCVPTDRCSHRCLGDGCRAVDPPRREGVDAGASGDGVLDAARSLLGETAMNAR